MLFGDVKTEKIGSYCVTGTSNIGIYSEHKNRPRFFCKKKKNLLPLFHKMLEGQALGMWLLNVFMGTCDFIV